MRRSKRASAVCHAGVLLLALGGRVAVAGTGGCSGTATGSLAPETPEPQPDPNVQDGERNGLFTGTLKKVWNGGKFTGHYRKFRDVIVSQMPPDQTPNYYFVGAANPDFEAQPPFTI